MTISWITPAGNLGTFTERVTLNIPLTATSNVGPVTFSLISGKLPRGLRLSQIVDNDSTAYTSLIRGSPTEVRIFTTSRFVIRASDGQDIEDRTFSITVDGDDIPQWITKEGFLNVGVNDAFYVLDNSRVDFQLEVRDPDVNAGDQLEFFLIASGGEMPPGLSLSKSGKISGFTDPIFALEYDQTPSGAYDSGAFDIIPLDVSANQSNGYDSYLYDFESFDYNETVGAPRRLSRFYTFIVGVTDGIHEIRRLFRIYVVTEEFLKSDNSIVQVDTNLFQADASGRRVPIWITESDLGRIRANNYVTLFLDVYDPITLPGYMTYFLLPTNPGTYRLRSTGEIITNGRYEITGNLPAFSYTLKGSWTPTLNYVVGDAVQAANSTDSTDRATSWVCIFDNINQAPGSTSSFWQKIEGSTYDQKFKLSNPLLWEVIEAESVTEVPPGLTIDVTTGNIAGRVPYQSAVTRNYKFTVQAVNFPPILFDENYTLTGDWSATRDYRTGEAVRYLGFIWLCILSHRNRNPEEGSIYWNLGVATSEKTFSADIVGEIESSIEWISESDLGIIPPNIPSTIKVEATSLIYGGRVVYNLVGGSLPPGLEIIPTNGQIQGKVRQFGSIAYRGFWNQGSQNIREAYNVNDVVEILETGNTYKCIFEHFSSSTFNPAYWELYSLSDRAPGLTRFFDTDSATDDSSRSRNFDVVFDTATTSFDRVFTFDIKAVDTSDVAESIKTFSITVNAEKNIVFANLYAKAFQSKDKRLAWYNFITDNNIFRENELYRFGDVNFGIQSEIKMLIYAGIESRDAQFFIQAMGQNHYNKQVRFGDVKSAVAKDPITQAILYEVVYVDIVDEYEKNGKSISKIVELSNTINSKVLVSYDSIKIDSDIPLASDRDHQRIFPNSYKNMRARIKAVGEREREFLPLWMRSIQPDGFVEAGFVKSVVLCYLKPGFSASVISRIKSSNFDFKSIDFTIDRYLIDALGGVLENKYLAFKQRGEKQP
jgi:hypothetical protein